MKASRATVRQMRALARVEEKLDRVLVLLGGTPQPEPEEVEAVVEEPAIEEAPADEPEAEEAQTEEPAVIEEAPVQEEAPAEEKPKGKK